MKYRKKKNYKLLDIKYTGLIFVIIVAFALFGAYFQSGEAGQSLLFDEIYLRGLAETTAKNLVAGIYLDYRLFDTLLEALLLLVSVIGVMQFSHLSTAEKQFPNQNKKITTIESSHVVRESLLPVYILIALFGLYIILTGMDGPGGGFQGGAILVAIFISAHFAQGITILNVNVATKIEKITYMLILIVGMFFIAYGANFTYLGHRIYLIIINILIGIKVCSGLNLIYMSFMFSEMEEDSGL
ncbi:MAG: MnhB domain-containing protein [Eubacteriales bacterium]